MSFPPKSLPFHLEDLLPALRDVVAGGEGAQRGLPQRHELRDGLVAGEFLQRRVVGLAQREQLREEHLVLHDLEVDGEEPRLEGGAEGVAIHEPDLRVDRLVAEQVLLGRDHVLQHLLVRLHHGRHAPALDLGEQAQRPHGLLAHVVVGRGHLRTE